MASYPNPTITSNFLQKVQIFNVNNFLLENESLTTETGDLRYFKNAGGIISGATTINNLLNVSSFRLTSDPSNNYVLTSDGSGNGTWQANISSLEGIVNADGPPKSISIQPNLTSRAIFNDYSINSTIPTEVSNVLLGRSMFSNTSSYTTTNAFFVNIETTDPSFSVYRKTTTATDNVMVVRSNEGTSNSIKTAIKANGDIETEGRLLAANGTGAAPGLSFKNRPGYGFFSAADDRFNLVTGGVIKSRYVNYSVTSTTPGQESIQFFGRTIFADIPEYKTPNLFYFNVESSQAVASFYRKNTSTTDPVLSIRSDNGTSNSVKLIIRTNGDIETNGSIIALSDSSVKKDIVDADIKSCIDVIKNLKVKRYRMISEENDAPLHYGLLAEDVNAIVPELVRKIFSKEPIDPFVNKKIDFKEKDQDPDPEHDLDSDFDSDQNQDQLGINYLELIPLLINSVKYLISSLEKSNLLD